MKTSFETPRLLLRELQPYDDHGMFELDSDPEVHRYLGNQPVQSIEESRSHIDHICGQYITNGIGRWAVILKETNEFIGWAGLKLEKNVNGYDSFYDLGYRFIPKHWGKGYATEAAKAWVDFGFNEMNLGIINAYTSLENKASQNTLKKCGLRLVNTFIYDNEPELWYEITRAEVIS
ncbi:MAG TPA: GNAT family N-acetyltransferase [Flavobacterium sp.]|jgi:RimJ/RimL family protein N-acetyltransferase